MFLYLSMNVLQVCLHINKFHNIIIIASFPESCIEFDEVEINAKPEEEKKK